ncbi:MAG: hypothetical protein AB1758_38155, partial [Candidatus Eremiobacterota bacterium]
MMQVSHVSLKVYPQDPRVCDPVPVTVPRDTFEPGRIRSAGLNLEAAPGTSDFARVNAHVMARRTQDLLEGYLGRSIPWAFGDRPLELKADHHPGRNAYYDRQLSLVSLQYFQMVPWDTTVRLANSADLTAHETAHAVLDGLRPGYGQGDNETLAFQEAFADCTALLVSLSFRENRALAVFQTGGNLRHPNLLSRFGEELGAALCYYEDPEREHLRSLLNSFRYVDPTTLPMPVPGKDDGILTSEPHSFSRVFSGAFYDVVEALYLHGIEREGLRPEEALRFAGETAGSLLMGAVDASPPDRGHFRDLAAGMMEADRRRNDG